MTEESSTSSSTVSALQLTNSNVARLPRKASIKSMNDGLVRIDKQPQHMSNKGSSASSNVSVREQTGTHEISTNANQIKYVIYLR